MDLQLVADQRGAQFNQAQFLLDGIGSGRASPSPGARQFHSTQAPIHAESGFWTPDLPCFGEHCRFGFGGFEQGKAVVFAADQVQGRL
jgi:hypothetical protein